jgi:hypothetical protein
MSHEGIDVRGSQAQRIRRLATRHVAVAEIARRLALRPAEVRRVLARSSKRGAPRKREASVTLSFVTTPEVAAAIRAAAVAREAPVSAVLDELVRAALARRETRGRAKKAVPASCAPASARVARAPGGRAPTTAGDAPEAVRKLLKSYDPNALDWENTGHRYEVVVAVLTRGNDEAKAWLLSVLPRREVRELVRQYHGAGCAEPDRALLRRLLRLSRADIPVRAYVGFGDRAGALMNACPDSYASESPISKR